MAVLQSTNVQGTLCVNGVAIGGGKDLKRACFTSSDDWTPPSGLVDGDGMVQAYLVGGGGGGGSACSTYTVARAGGGGGAGGVNYTMQQMTSSNDACTITVGAGGSGGDGDGTAAGNGGTTCAFGCCAGGGGFGGYDTGDGGCGILNGNFGGGGGCQVRCCYTFVGLPGAGAGASVKKGQWCCTNANCGNLCLSDSYPHAGSSAICGNRVPARSTWYTPSPYPNGGARYVSPEAESGAAVHIPGWGYVAAGGRGGRVGASSDSQVNRDGAIGLNWGGCGSGGNASFHNQFNRCTDGCDGCDGIVVLMWNE